MIGHVRDISSWKMARFSCSKLEKKKKKKTKKNREADAGKLKEEGEEEIKLLPGYKMRKMSC